MKVYIIDEETHERLVKISNALHAGSDAMRDQGHVLWLMLARFVGPMDIKDMQPAEGEGK